MIDNMNSDIEICQNIEVRSGNEPVYVDFYIKNKENSANFDILYGEHLKIKLVENDLPASRRKLAIYGFNESDEAVWEDFKIILSDGQTKVCHVLILPGKTQPPRFLDTPFIRLEDGKAVLYYDLDLKGATDQSDIRWYRIDNINRASFKKVELSKTSNEKDSRKIAQTRGLIPCKSIRLTPDDIGKHIKVNIRAKSDRSDYGAGLNIESPIVKDTDVNKGEMILNIQNLVVDNSYGLEAGYMTFIGDFSVKKNTGDNRWFLCPESMGAGFFYSCDRNVEDMAIVMLVDPQDNSGNGFDGPKQYIEIYIKYDMFTRTGYSFRIESTPADDGNVLMSFMHYKKGSESIIGATKEASVFKNQCEITVEYRNDTLSAYVSYDDGQDFCDVELHTAAMSNTYGGYGYKHMADIDDRHGVKIKYMEARYLSDEISQA